MTSNESRFGRLGATPDNVRALCRRGMAFVAFTAVVLAAAACSSSGHHPARSSTRPPPPAAVTSSSAAAPTTSAVAATSTTAAAPTGLSGTWHGNYSGSYTGTFTVTWTQTDVQLHGSISISNPAQTLPLTGTLAGSTITFGTVGSAAITYTGTVNGSTMSGSYTVGGQPAGSWSATRG